MTEKKFTGYENIITLVLEPLPLWHAFELGEYNSGLSQAKEFMFMPFEVDADVSPHVDEILWESSSISFVIGPSRDAMTEEMYRSGFCPFLINISTLTSLDQDTRNILESEFISLGEVADVESNIIGRIKGTVTEGEDGEAYASVVFLFDEHDVYFGAISEISAGVEDRKEHLNEIVSRLARSATNTLYLSYLRSISANTRAQKSASDYAFNLSITGQFTSEDGTPIYPLVALDGWSLHFHNGSEAIHNILLPDSLSQHPMDSIRANSAKLFELPIDEASGLHVFSLGHNGNQFFLSPPEDDRSIVGATPLLVMVKSNDLTIVSSTPNYVVIHGSESEPIFALRHEVEGPVTESNGEETYSIRYSAVIPEYRVGISAIYVSYEAEPSSTYDAAFITLAENIQSSLSSQSVS